jgi:hypothetical protein
MRVFIIVFFILITQFAFSQKGLPSWVTNSNVKHPDFNSKAFISGDVVSVKYNSNDELEKAKEKARFIAEKNVFKAYSASALKEEKERDFDESEENINGKISFKSKDIYSDKSTINTDSFLLIGVESKVVEDKKKKTIYAVAAFNAYETKKLYTSKIDKLNRSITENVADAKNAILEYRQSEDVNYKMKATKAYNKAINAIKEIESNATLFEILNLNYYTSESLKETTDAKENLLNTTLNLNDFAYGISETLKDKLGKKDAVEVYPAKIKGGKSTRFSIDLNKLIKKELSTNTKPWGILNKEANNKIKYKIRGEYDIIGKDSVINYKIAVFENKKNTLLFTKTFELKNTILKKEKYTFRDKGTEKLIEENNRIIEALDKNDSFDVDIAIFENKEDVIYSGQNTANEDEVILKQGNKYRFAITSNKNGYLRIIFKEKEGGIALLVDNEHIVGDRTPREIPFTLGIGPPFGNEKLLFQFSETRFTIKPALKRVYGVKYIKDTSMDKTKSRTRGGLNETKENIDINATNKEFSISVLTKKNN